MAKILSSASGGHGGHPSSSCLNKKSLLTSELKQVIIMKVVGNFLILPLTKFYIIWPSRTPAMGKNSEQCLGWIAGQILTSLLWPNFEFENNRFRSFTIHECCRPIS